MADTPGNRWLAEAGGRAATYDERWAQMAAEGKAVHGEADLVYSMGPDSVLDGGCGTGRVGAELARRGVDVVGVDLDPAMLAKARERSPSVTWVAGDLADLDLGRTFDVVLLAGNVMIYVEPGTEGRVLTALARHMTPGGALVAGFQLDPGRLDLPIYEALATEAGLAVSERWATWERAPYEGGPYAVSVHRPQA